MHFFWYTIFWTHIVELEFVLVLLLQVPRKVVKDGSAATAVGVKAGGPSHLMHLQTRLLICRPPTGSAKQLEATFLQE